MAFCSILQLFPPRSSLFRTGLAPTTPSDVFCSAPQAKLGQLGTEHGRLAPVLLGEIGAPLVRCVSEQSEIY